MKTTNSLNLMMRSRGILLFVLFALLSNGVLAQKSKRAPKTPAVKGSALLYKVTGKGLKKPSYLFGTMHIVCGEDLTFSKKLGPYLTSSQQMMLEVDMSDANMTTQATFAAIMKDGKTIKDLVEPEVYEKLDVIYKEYLGIPIAALANFKPIMVSTVLFTSPKIVGCPVPAKLDSDLAEIAKASKKKVIGLESVQDQIAVLDSAPMSEQLRSLNEIAADVDKQVKLFRDMYKLYLEQNSDGLFELMSKVSAEQPAFMSSLLDDRNKKWIPLIESNIKIKPTFVAFGAGHLGGENGVVALLRARGYVVTPIRL